MIRKAETFTMTVLLMAVYDQPRVESRRHFRSANAGGSRNISEIPHDAG
jgi:hypothetical protein